MNLLEELDEDKSILDKEKLEILIKALENAKVNDIKIYKIQKNYIFKGLIICICFYLLFLKD